jgi:ribosomal protein S25
VRARAALVCCVPVWLLFHRSRVGLFVAVYVFRRLLRRADVKEVVPNKKRIVKIFLPKTWD